MTAPRRSRKPYNQASSEVSKQVEKISMSRGICPRRGCSRPCFQGKPSRKEGKCGLKGGREKTTRELTGQKAITRRVDAIVFEWPSCISLSTVTHTARLDAKVTRTHRTPVRMFKAAARP